MIDQTWISLVSAVTALFASVAGPIVTLRVGRQQFKANVLSVNRQRWIDTTRDALAHLVAQLQSAAAVRETFASPGRVVIGADANLLSRVEELARTIAKLDLLLNPTEADHRKLRGLMEQALSFLRADTVAPTLSEDIDGLTKEIVVTAQSILKREWVRVKRGT